MIKDQTAGQIPICCGTPIKGDIVPLWEIIKKKKKRERKKPYTTHNDVFAHTRFVQVGLMVCDVRRSSFGILYPWELGNIWLYLPCSYHFLNFKTCAMGALFAGYLKIYIRGLSEFLVSPTRLTNVQNNQHFESRNLKKFLNPN